MRALHVSNKSFLFRLLLSMESNPSFALKTKAKTSKALSSWEAVLKSFSPWRITFLKSLLRRTDDSFDANVSSSSSCKSDITLSVIFKPSFELAYKERHENRLMRKVSNSRNLQRRFRPNFTWGEFKWLSLIERLFRFLRFKRLIKLTSTLIDGYVAMRSAQNNNRHGCGVGVLF